MTETGWWANLLQDALSAVIGGVVAALTAWAVVTMTARRTQRQTTYQNAVLACQALAGEIHTLAQVISPQNLGAGAGHPPSEDNSSPRSADSSPSATPTRRSSAPGTGRASPDL